MQMGNTYETIDFAVTLFVAFVCLIICVVAIVRVLIGGKNKHILIDFDPEFYKHTNNVNLCGCDYKDDDDEESDDLYEESPANPNNPISPYFFGLFRY